MPELPEVQTVINYLKTKIINQKINNVIVSALKVLKTQHQKNLRNSLSMNTLLTLKELVSISSLFCLTTKCWFPT